MADRKLGFSTLQIHGGQSVDKTTGSRAVLSIYRLLDFIGPIPSITLDKIFYY